MSGIECPYCNYEDEVDYCGDFGCEEGEYYETQCNSCGMNFQFDTAVTLSYNTYKADCLNGSLCIWEPTRTHPRSYTEMKCKTCQTRREPTEEEKKIHNIPEKS